VASRNHALARRSTSSVNREPGSAHGTRVVRTPCVAQWTRGHPGAEHGPKLTGVQVAPASLGVIVDRTRGRALGTTEGSLRHRRDPHLHLTRFRSSLDLLDLTRGLEPQNRLIQRPIAHLASWLKSLARSYPPTRFPEEPQKM
jgi:hypothetical protein